MASFYGTTRSSKTRNVPVTRCGYTDVTSSVQTWEGSLITSARYKGWDGDEYNKEILFSIEIADGSSSSGWPVWEGTLDELSAILRSAKANR